MDRNRVRSLFVDRCGANFFVDGKRREKEERERRRDTPGVRGRGTTLYRFTVES